MFVYALEQVRNPDRRYEVYRMTGLPGIPTRRAGAPALPITASLSSSGGRHSRALYNDVDQLYRRPGASCSTNRWARNRLSGARAQALVMLIDCERMHCCWNMQAATTTTSKKAACARLRRYRAGWRTGCHLACSATRNKHGESRLLHFTTLHLQPWRPLPGSHGYQAD